MFLVITRNFPPDIGGIQVLMGELSEILLNHGPVKVFADEFPNSRLYDSKSAANIERIKGIKLFKKYRKANLVNNFINENSNIRAILTDHWKSLELLKDEYLKQVEELGIIVANETKSKGADALLGRDSDIRPITYSKAATDENKK